MLGFHENRFQKEAQVKPLKEAKFNDLCPSLKENTLHPCLCGVLVQLESFKTAARLSSSQAAVLEPSRFRKTENLKLTSPSSLGPRSPPWPTGRLHPLWPSPYFSAPAGCVRFSRSQRMLSASRDRKVPQRTTLISPIDQCPLLLLIFLFSTPSSFPLPPSL